MRYIAFLKISTKSFASVDDMYITSSDHMSDIQVDVEKFWEDKAAIHYAGLNIIIVYNVIGAEMREAYASAAIYDHNLKIEYRANHETEYDLLYTFPTLYRRIYLPKIAIDQHDSLRTNKLESLAVRLKRFHIGNDRTNHSNKQSIRYIAFISHHGRGYSPDANQTIFGTGDNLDQMRSKNGIYWDSNNIQHPQGMNIIRIYDIFGETPVEVWASIAIYDNQNRILNRSTSDTLDDAISYLNFSNNQYSVSKIKLDQIPLDIIERAKQELGINPKFQHPPTWKPSQDNQPLTNSDITAQIRAARIEEYGEDLPDPITIKTPKRWIPPPTIV